ncbi:hypothetical protein CO611_00770 [Lysobacteraceae bacterium NML03-0222]|nr:hypothetical protein CO611_00770 [Xanthomonadaceae bacterium NML03-0222]
MRNHFSWRASCAVTDNARRKTSPPQATRHCSGGSATMYQGGRQARMLVSMSSTPSSRSPSTPQLALDAMLTGETGGILRHAMWLDAANRAWRAQLPADLRGHLRLGNFNHDDGSLSALADTPAWAERARLATDLLINAARASGLPARRIKVRVARHAPPPLHVAEKPPTAASVTAVKQIMAMLRQE